MRRWFRIFPIVILVFGCAGLENQFVSSLNQYETTELTQIDLELLDYSFSTDPLLYQKIETQLERLLNGAIPNREYKAELLGMRGTALFYKGDREAAASVIPLLERESVAEARLYTLKALLLKERSKQITLLTDGLEKANNKGLVRLHLAEWHFDGNDFRRALAAYDEAFLALPSRYRDYYKKKRDLAFRFLEQPPVRTETHQLLAKTVLSFADVLLLTLRESRFFDSVTIDKNIAIDALLYQLKNKVYLHEENSLPQTLMPRREVAFLTLRILSILENDPSLLKRYAGAERDAAASPVPDVATSSYYYTAVLVLVEREIMDLPDGKNFFPEKGVSGEEYFEIIKKLRSKYGM